MDSERIKHGKSRAKEIIMVIIMVMVIGVSWLIDVLLYPNKPVLQHPAFPVSVFVICLVLMYISKPMWLKKVIIIKQKLNFMRIIRIITNLLIIILILILAEIFWWLIVGPLLSDLFPTYHPPIKIIMICTVVLIFILSYKFKPEWWRPIEF